MISPKVLLVVLVSFFIYSCNQTTDIKNKAENEQVENVATSQKIEVLNFATFHLGYTNDARSITFDEKNERNVDSIHQIAKKLSLFKPTVIIVETIPEYNQTLQLNYSSYLKDPNTIYEEPNEVELLAFEVGRLAGTKQIFGIDHKLEYDYNIGSKITNSIDSITHHDFQSNPFKTIPDLNIFKEGLSLYDKLTMMNQSKFLDFLITANADILTYVGSENGFEGADEAAKYYKRNLRIYSNLNRLLLNKNDRVFILSGGSHTAFLREFMRRDEKYEMVNTFKYLN